MARGGCHLSLISDCLLCITTPQVRYNAEDPASALDPLPFLLVLLSMVGLCQTQSMLTFPPAFPDESKKTAKVDMQG